MTISVEDICNKALRRIGYSTPIGNIQEGSTASRVAIEIYVQTRDDVTVEGDWQFARQESGLTLMKIAPVGGYGITPWTSTYPLLPWIYEYAYPSNCLKLRSLRPTLVIMPDYDPTPNTFTVANDPSILPGPVRVILSNCAAPIASFTAVVDNPDQWTPQPQFIEALIEKLALRFQEALAPKTDEVKARMVEVAGSTAMGQGNRG